MLLLFRTLLDRHDLGNKLYRNSKQTVRGLHIPAQYANIVGSVRKKSASFNHVISTRLKLDRRYWGDVEQDGTPLKQPTCVYFDILELIACKCLFLKDIKKFKVSFEDKTVIDSFHSADFVKETEAMLKKK